MAFPNQKSGVSLISDGAVLLTVITVTRNNFDGLVRTVESVEALRLSGVEHVIVDGSDDFCREENLSFCNRAGVYYLYRKPDGISDAFNSGLMASSGVWVWYLNSGDSVHEYIDPAWLLWLLKSSAADIITGGILYGGEAQVRYAPKLADRWPLLSCWLPHPATLVRRHLLVAVGGFDVSYKIAMDYELWFRLLEKDATVDVLSIPLARFELGGVSNQERTRAQLLREEGKIILSHGWHLFWQSVRTSPRVAVRLVRALRHQLGS